MIREPATSRGFRAVGTFGKTGWPKVKFMRNVHAPPKSPSRQVLDSTMTGGDMEK